MYMVVCLALLPAPNTKKKNEKKIKQNKTEKMKKKKEKTALKLLSLTFWYIIISQKREGKLIRDRKEYYSTCRRV